MSAFLFSRRSTADQISLVLGHSLVVFQNSILTKKNRMTLLNFIKFDIIQLNFDWMRFCTIKNRKIQNQLNLPINRTDWSKFGLIHLKFGGIVKDIEV
jgi:hypothetical protein